MVDNRPPIPRPLARDVKTEAGHRCAIPTCRATSGLEIHHIVDYAQVREHTFDNLIYLCAICHARATTGEIDRLAMRQYKANLSVVANRYGDLERRVLELFAGRDGDHLELPGGMDILLWYLLRDGLLVKAPPIRPTESLMGHPVREVYRLTAAGREFVDRWVHARELDDSASS